MKYTPAIKADYERKFATCVVDYKADAVRATAKRILSVRKACGGFGNVPWFFIALCWLREANLNPKAVLHNGELIVGTGAKTKLVPKGRGPFASWREAADDALRIQGLYDETDWSIGKMLFRFEGFNGFGYRNRGVPSPYLWSHTNHYADGSWDDDPKGGKYVADGKYRADVYDAQIGIAAVLKVLADAGDIDLPGEPPVALVPRTGKASKVVVAARAIGGGTAVATAGAQVAASVGGVSDTIEQVKIVTDQAGDVVDVTSRVINAVPDGVWPWLLSIMRSPTFLTIALVVVILAWVTTYAWRRFK